MGQLLDLECDAYRLGHSGGYHVLWFAHLPALRRPDAQHGLAHRSVHDDAHYYDGKDFFRIASGFPTPSDYILQGGAKNADGSGSSGNTPFTADLSQQLAFTGVDQLSMAAANPGQNDTQFFVSTGQPSNFDLKFAIFGQLVSGADTLAKMTQVSTGLNPILNSENSLPVNPVLITTAVVTSSNPNGVVHIDATSAHPGETANITVTATDGVDHTQVVRTFKVTTGAYNGPTDPQINFKPFAAPVSVDHDSGRFGGSLASGPERVSRPGHPSTLSYAIITPPSHGTITGFNPRREP